MLTSASRPESARLWYEEKVRRYGFDHRGLGFRNRSSQEKRFEALARLGDFEGRSVLDAGCGFGDFLAFLEERDLQATYTGIDMCAPMIERCRERFPMSEGRFHVADVMEYQPQACFDFVIASGIFGLDAEGARERVRPTLERMFRWCRLGMAVNFLSARAPEKVPARLYVDPADALEWAFALAPAVRLDHGYLPNDFTLLLHRNPSWVDGSSGGHA
ncbi:MAG: class I SAM-dependent methyltransferase [Bacillota bacterium]